jgi:TP901 family phage tail tape measure protein
MSTVTSLGFNIVSRYNGTGSRMARKDIAATEATGKKSGGIMAKAGKGAAVGIALIGGAAFKSALDYDKATKSIRTSTGATGNKLAGLTKSFDNVNKNVGASAGDVAAALSELHKRTGSTGTALEDLTKTELRLGTLTGKDVPDLIGKTTRVFGDWSIATKDQSKSLDWLYKVSQHTGIGVDELAQKTVEFGAPLRTMGFSFEEATAMLGKWEKEGVNTTMALGGMKQALGKFAKAGKDPKKSMMELFDQIKRAPTLGKAAAIAVGAFGKRAGPDMADAIRGGKFDLESMLKVLKKSPETIESATKASGSFAGKMNLMKKQASLALIPLGQGLLTTFMAIAPSLIQLSTGIGNLSQWFGRLPGPVRTAVIALTAFVLLLPKFKKIGSAISVMAGGMVKGFMWIKNACVGTRIQLMGLWIQEKLTLIWGKLTYAAMKIWTGIQWAWNAAMEANPIGIVVVLIVALVAAIIIAYKHSATFRAIVQATWRGIQAVAMAVWHGFLQPVFKAFVAAMKWVAGVAVWLYKVVIKPIWALMLIVFKVWWWGVKVYFAFFKLGIKALAVVVQWLYKSIIKPVIGFIMVIFRLWWTGTKMYFNLWKQGIKYVGQAAVWLWKSAIKPTFGFIMANIRTMGAVFKWLYDHGVKPPMRAAGQFIHSIWTGTIRVAFNAIKAGVNTVRSSFKTAVAGIKVAWKGLEAATKAPVKFFVNTVYNNGLRKAWNNTAGKIPGVPDMGEAKLPRGFARGGFLGRGQRGPNDKVPIMAQAGEYMIRAKRVRELGKGWLDRVNFGGHNPNGEQGFKGGGIIGAIKGLAKGAVSGLTKGFNWATGFTRSIAGKALSALFKPVRALTNGIVNKFPQSGVVGKFIKGFANQGFDKMIDWVKGKAAPDPAAGIGGGKVNVGGSGVQRWAGIVKQVLSMLHQPASALGPVLSRIRQESGGNPNAINNWDINAKRGDPSRGLMQTIGSTFSAYAGPYRSRGIYDPLANIYAGINYARHRYGGNWINVMTRPGGYKLGGMIPTQAFDSGKGVLQPGYTMAYNGTGRPESLSTSNANGATEEHYHLDLRGAIITGGTREFEDLFVRTLSEAKRKKRIK